MQKTLFLSTALGAAMLLGGAPAFGQSGMAPSAVPQHQQQDVRGSDAMTGQREISGLLRQADQAVASGNWTRANEMLERAQTTVLNAHGGSAGGGQGAIGLPNFDEARQAIAGRNRAEARRALQAVMSDSSAAMGSGADAGRMAAQGGGGGMGHSAMSGHGSATMRDGGLGDRSMSRADIILAQSGGGGSGGLSGSTPGSPGTGTPGSTPSQMPGTAVQPPQTSALPGAGSSTTGPGAPAPGTLTPAPGSTDAGSRTTTGSGGANPPRGTTGGQNR
jgi:hypothetical protein